MVCIKGRKFVVKRPKVLSVLIIARYGLYQSREKHILDYYMPFSPHYSEVWFVSMKLSKFYRVVPDAFSPHYSEVWFVSGCLD